MLTDFPDFADPGCLFIAPLVVLFIVCCLDSHNKLFFSHEGY